MLTRGTTTNGSRKVVTLLVAMGLGCAGATPVPNAATPASSASSGAAPAPAATGTPPAAAAAPASPALPLDPSVSTGTLSNGLSYYLKRQKPKDQRVLLMLVVKAGSLDEADDQRGAAHFIEHMAFNGTRRFAKQALIDFLEKSGLSFGSDLNAATSFDRTQYQLSVPTDDPKLLATALDILEDWASAVTFEPEAVVSERPVVLSEWLARRGMARRVAEQTRDLVLAGSRYIERDPIGDKATLEQMGRQHLVEFYERWYRPERMAVVAVGDIEPASIEAAIRERFSRLSPGPAVSRVAADVPLQKGPVAAVITDPELPASSVGVVFEAPGHPWKTEADFRAQLLSGLGSQMLDRRFAEIAQRPDAPFTGAASSLAFGMLGKLDLLQVGARAKAGQIPASLDVLLTELERVKRHGFTAGELARTKTEYARSLEHRVAGKDTVPLMPIAAGLANSFVTGEAFTAPELDRELGLRLLGEVSERDVTAAIVARTLGGRELVIASGAARDAMPEKSSLLTAITTAEQAPVEAYEDRLVSTELLPRAPLPGRIVSEKRVEEVGVSVWTLSNGARVVLKPTDFSEDEIVEQSTSFGGNGRVPRQDFASARFATDIVRAGGVGEFDRQALIKALAGKVVSVAPWIDELSEGIGGRAAPKDVETLFQLIYLYATAPRRDEPAFEAWRAGVREQLRNRDVDPGAVFGDAVARQVWGDEPRRSAPTAASMDQVKLDTALKFYAERFADVSDFTFVFVGKIDEAAFRPLVERYIASLPGKGRKEAYKDVGLHRHKGITRVAVQAGKEDKSSVMLMFHGESKWSEHAHTDLSSLESYLTIRIREVLRERLGGVYTPYVSSSFERLPFNSYSLVISFECKPAEADMLEQAARDVIADVKKSGIDENYVLKLKSQRTRNLEESYRTNGFWLGRLVSKYRLGEDPREILILTALTERVTSDNVRLAARKFLRDDQYIDARRTPALPPAPAASAQAPPSSAAPAVKPAAKPAAE
jgi:zinc protease